MTDKLTNLINKLNEVKRLMKEQGEAAFKEAFKEFFDNHPAALGMVWVQYTPYFNDGDVCTFRLGGIELKVNKNLLPPGLQDLLTEECFKLDYFHEEGCAYCELAQPYKEEPRYLPPLVQSMCDDFKVLEKNLRSLKDLLLTILDDHVKVMVTRNGIETEEYDHE